MHEDAGFQRPEMIRRRAADIETTLQIDIDDAVPVFLGHAVCGIPVGDVAGVHYRFACASEAVRIDMAAGSVFEGRDSRRQSQTGSAD